MSKAEANELTETKVPLSPKHLESQKAAHPDPLRIWNKVKATDPKYTKEANNGKYDFTAVDPQYQLQEATKLWGPYGIHWGLRDLKFQFLESCGMVVLEAYFFYPAILDVQASKLVEFPIAVDGKLRAGDDVCKKLITSARSKALSFLGFSADVFMGQFDDAQYVKDLETRFGEQNAFLTKAVAQIRTAKTEGALERCEHRANEMIANGTVSPEAGASLLDEIAARLRVLQSEPNEG